MDRGSSSQESSSSGRTSVAEKIKGKERNHGDIDAQTLCRTCTSDSVDSQCGETDGEDDDDVFLESWEEVAAAAISTANG